MLLEHFQSSTSADLILPQESWTRDIIPIAVEVSTPNPTSIPLIQLGLTKNTAKVPYACHTCCVCVPYAKASGNICDVIDY